MPKILKIFLYCITLFLVSFSVGHAGETDINVDNQDFDVIPQEDAWNPEGTAINPANIPKEEFYRAEILEIVNEGSENTFDGEINEYQDVKALIINGQEKDKIIETRHGGLVPITQHQKVKSGDNVVLVKIYNADGEADYFINDHYRINAMAMIFAIFIGLAIFLGKKKGVGALLGLVFSILILAKFIVPRIISGYDPIVTTLMGAFLIATVSIFMAHGINRRTVIAFMSTIITFTIAVGLSALFVKLAYLFGKGTEEAFYIQTGSLGHINLQGLLLAGIVIGTLGVLDDVTTTQTAVVGELKLANLKLSVYELYKRGMIVGKEHIASMVNTLVLVYAGAALPLFLLFSVNQYVPFWVLINSEQIAEEIIRTIVGSSALLLAAPISTILAAYLLKSKKASESQNSHTH